MFQKFKSKPGSPSPSKEASTVHRKRMDLEQRKAYRQEMLYQSVREIFLAMEVVTSMYKFKVMPVDTRHHRFIVMIDVAKSFVTDKDSRTKSFAAIENRLRLDTYNRYGILIAGVYWRVSQTDSQFERFTREADTPQSSVEPELREPIKAAQAAKSGNIPMARQAYQPVSDEEAAAFMGALQQGLAPPPVHVGDMAYESDLAPLDGGIMIGGTQYGRLE